MNASPLFVVSCDFETGGTDPKVHAPLSLALVAAAIEPQANGAWKPVPIAQQHWCMLVGENLAVCPTALKVQGLSLSALESEERLELAVGPKLLAPTVAKWLADLGANFRPLTMVAHSSDFDEEFLRAFLWRGNVKPPYMRFLCTRKLHYLLQAMGRVPNGTKEAPMSGKLADVAAHFVMEQPNPHNAMDDARLTVRVLAAQLQLLSLSGFTPEE